MFWGGVGGKAFTTALYRRLNVSASHGGRLRPGPPLPLWDIETVSAAFALLSRCFAIAARTRRSTSGPSPGLVSGRLRLLGSSTGSLSARLAAPGTCWTRETGFKRGLASR